MIDEHNGSDSVYYIREPDGELIARIGSSSVAYYHFDALGSTRLLTDVTGTVTDTYAYDAWGKSMAHTGTTTQPYQFVGQLGYYTHWQDENLALLQLGVRFYDPQAGRFGQRDPIKDGMNWYAYVRNLPTLLTDPSGAHPRGTSERRLLAGPELADTICKMWKCAHEMAEAAKQEAIRGGAKGWKLDALRHCTGICKMAIHCPAGTAYLAYLHEWVIIWSPNWGACAMDFSNNGRGLYCAR